MSPPSAGFLGVTQRSNRHEQHNETRSRFGSVIHINRVPEYEAGLIENLTSGLSVTLGKVVNVTRHPSGPQFDGPAVIIAAYCTNIGVSPRPYRVQLVSLSDPGCRILNEDATQYADS